MEEEKVQNLPFAALHASDWSPFASQKSFSFRLVIDKDI
jgi:hypothetical protein